MALEFFDDLCELVFPDCDPENASASRDGIIEVLTDLDVSVDAAQMSEEELLALPGHVLFAWVYDYDMSLTLYAILESALSDQLAEALKIADNSGYAYDEMAVGDDGGQAFIRIDAAMGLEVADDLIELLSAPIPKADIDCFRPYQIARFEDGEEPEIEDGAFDKRFVSSCTVRRSQ